MRATWSPLGKGTDGGGSGHRVYSGLVTRQVVEGVPGSRPQRGGGLGRGEWPRNLSELSGGIRLQFLFAI